MTEFEGRGVSRSVKALSLGVLVLVAAALAAAVEPARACSCIPPDPWAFLEKADGAFVGRLVSRREAGEGRAVLTFSVERAVKGRIGAIVEVETSSSGASCGIETRIGQRIGLFLGREAGRWSGNLCAQVAAKDLLAAAALPAPNGRGDVAILVGGRFGPARTLALDAQNRTLAYGMGAGRLSAFSVCPGGGRVAEIAQLGSGYTLTLRELSTLRLIRQQRLELSYPSSLRCQSASGEQLVVFSGSGPDLERRARLVRITPGSTTTIWRGTSWHASLAVRHAYVTAVGGSLLAVDLRTRAVKKLAPTPGGAHYLTPNPPRTRFASLAFTEGVGRPRLVIVDTRRRPASVRVVPLTNATGDVLWLARGRLALLQNPTAFVFDSELRVVSRFRWQAEDGTLVGSIAFGVRGNGRLVSAQLPSGPTRPIRRLPGRPHLIVLAAN